MNVSRLGFPHITKLYTHSPRVTPEMKID